MKKVESTLENIRDDIKKFYDYKVWHFITMNGVALDGERFEVQWIFSRYEAMDESVIYYTVTEYDKIIPSIEDIIPSSIISQREVVDMFGVKIDGSEAGLYLDADSLQMPLRGCGL
ncbi:MAG: NADH-quinone oxidoreductase subunit C [Campylobacterales bacterium]|nr:NADH-quinone oxidoreductase subunit C [Campylobacterales bacterium]